MKKDKSPGCDGIQVEVLQAFWPKIGKWLFNAILESIQNKILFRSTRRGILTLITKKDKDPMYVKNWRPIILMNTDHKVFAKVLANRLLKVIHYIIGKKQTGYIKGKFIGLSIRKLIDLIFFVEKEEIPALLISVGFQKCFNTIEFQAIEGALAYFGIGPNFTNMILLLYKEFQVAIVHNGYVSKWYLPK